MLQRNCNREVFLCQLRKVFVDAIISNKIELNVDKESWLTLLGSKGSQFNSGNAKIDFKGAFEMEAKLMNKDKWVDLMRKRRRELGNRVNRFENDILDLSKQIPCSSEINEAYKAINLAAQILGPVSDSAPSSSDDAASSFEVQNQKKKPTVNFVIYIILLIISKILLFLASSATVNIES